MTRGQPPAGRPIHPHAPGPGTVVQRLWVAATVVTAAVLLTAGGLGAFRYANTFALYRGFPAPSIPQSVVVTGPHGS